MQLPVLGTDRSNLESNRDRGARTTAANTGEFPPLEQQQHKQSQTRKTPKTRSLSARPARLCPVTKQAQVLWTLADHERRLTNIENQLKVMTEQLAPIPVMIQQLTQQVTHQVTTQLKQWLLANPRATRPARSPRASYRASKLARSDNTDAVSRSTELETADSQSSPPLLSPQINTLQE
ncbi:hypothetical protein HPB51_008864 [Rhipicephalus microplus]|uniref:Uncharacterized protein n=1 Tax=Rhipicephalus microplus TaxID=6941 RepID=A0A9J6ES32_RHIMP|nr:hypothetical protein HPB51_008864 [Rhipicephalus microplus]